MKKLVTVVFAVAAVGYVVVFAKGFRSYLNSQNPQE